VELVLEAINNLSAEEKIVFDEMIMERLEHAQEIDPESSEILLDLALGSKLNFHFLRQQGGRFNRP
jgi:hypothetical protein